VEWPAGQRPPLELGGAGGEYGGGGGCEQRRRRCHEQYQLLALEVEAAANYGSAGSVDYASRENSNVSCGWCWC
jgi:hypothetical protein